MQSESQVGLSKLQARLSMWKSVELKGSPSNQQLHCTIDAKREYYNATVVWSCKGLIGFEHLSLIRAEASSGNQRQKRMSILL